MPRSIFPVALSLACFTLTMFQGPSAHAALFSLGFQRITSNASVDVASQFGVTVYDATTANSTFGLSLNPDEILMTVTNAVGQSSAISEVYIDDGTIFAQSAVHNSLGGFTQFTGPGASPPVLPGGSDITPPFVATATFSADAVGNPSRGVDAADDILGISYQLLPGTDFVDVFAAVLTGDLRVGFHVRAIGDDEEESDSFVNTTDTLIIPEPASLALVGLGTFLMLNRRQRR